MGGKTKQSQRTKNNVRPSSSSRSAEILNNSVNQEGGLVAVGGGKLLPALFPTLAAVNLEQGLNPEIQMCIKKLNKKDPITRAKAVQELCELVNNGNPEDVVAALPSWAHFYKSLTADTDRKVREVTQQCHHAIMRVCGRRAAPQLKSILPSWLQAQYDEHAPAQTNAQQSLKATFPDSKLPEVISFCKAEVMAHLLENLIGNTEAVISKKIENPEERELQMCRIRTSSLRGLEYFTPNLPAPHHEWLWQELTPLLDTNTHWKFATHSAHQVRAAWYGAMGRIIERYKGQFGEKYGQKIMRLMLNATRDNNPLVAAQVWTCLLQFMHNIEDWHNYLDKKELLIKRILDILETGGWGDAKHLSMMLLPLLAHLPQDILTKEFYESFFDAVYKGLDNKNVLTSKSEQKAWVTSLAECLRYLSIQDNDFVPEVVTSVHRIWLEKVLAGTHDTQTKINLIKASATNMTSLVKYWLKQAAESKTDKYEQLLRNYWQNIGSTVLSQIEKSGTDLEEIGKTIEGHITLLITLKSSFVQETKKKQNIKFHGDETTAQETTPVASEQLDASIIERYKHNMDDVVQKICSSYFEMAEAKQVSNAVLAPLITVLVEFDSKNLFVAIARQFNLDSSYKLYESKLRPWLAGDTMRCKAIVDILFMMTKYMTEEEQDAMFASFKQFTPAVVEWCLSVCMSHPYIQQAASRRWLQSAVASEALAALAQRGATHTDAKATALCFMSLAGGPDGEPLISNDGILRVIRTVSKAVETYSSPNLDSGGRLAARLVTTLASTEHVVTKTEEFTWLVLYLFRINLSVPRGSPQMTHDTWSEVLSSWQDGVAVLTDEQRKMFLNHAVQMIHSELFDKIDAELNIAKLDHMVSLCPYFFNRSMNKGSDQPDDVTEIISFTEQLFKMTHEEDLLIETCALRHLCITAQINCLYEYGNEAAQNMIKSSNDQNVEEITKPQIITFLNKYIFHAIYMKTLLLHKVESDEESEDDSRKSWCDTLLKNNYIKNEYCKDNYFFVLFDSLHEGYTFWPHYDLLVEAKKRLDTVMNDIIADTSKPVRDTIANALSELAVEHGYFWALAHRLYRYNGISDLTSDEPTDFGEGDIQKGLTGNGFFHMIQAATKWSTCQDFKHSTAYLIMARCWNVTSPEQIKQDFVATFLNDDDFDLDIIIKAFNSRKQLLLYNTDISKAPWDQVVSNAAVLGFMEYVVKNEGWETSSHHWDFIAITLVSLMSSVTKSNDWACTKVVTVARAVFRLFHAVQSFVSTIHAESMRRQPEAHIVHLVKEWKDIFAPEFYYDLYACMLNVLESQDVSTFTVSKCQYVLSLINAVPEIQWKVLTPRKLALLPLERIARCCAAVMGRPTHPSVKYLSYYLIVNVSKDLVFDDAQKLEMWSDESVGEVVEDKARPVFSLDYFHDTFTHVQEIVETSINHLEPGEAICDLVPFTDSHSMALGWLLLADAMAAICRLARGDLTQFYIQIYREGKYTAPQLTACLRLLPSEVFVYANDNTGNTPVPAQYKPAFLGVRAFDMTLVCGPTDIPALACRGILTAVCGAGCSAARGWWGAARPPVARALERVVIAYVAPHAIKEQLTHLQDRASEISDSEIRIAWSSNEVVCDYSVEESTLQLRVVMSRAHPLVPPRLTAPAAGPATNTQWLTLYLAYQNGTLLNALKMWTEAVNARVEKSPQCYICYCRLHPGTGRLPRVPCHQCKNKFHDMCLRKWFSTSNKSNCPLCRATF